MRVVKGKEGAYGLPCSHEVDRSAGLIFGDFQSAEWFQWVVVEAPWKGGRNISHLTSLPRLFLSFRFGDLPGFFCNRPSAEPISIKVRGMQGSLVASLQARRFPWNLHMYSLFSVLADSCIFEDAAVTDGHSIYVPEMIAFRDPNTGSGTSAVDTTCRHGFRQTWTGKAQRAQNN